MTTIADPESFRANIRIKIQAIINDTETNAINLEKGIFNYAIKEANIQKIVKKWENPSFVQIYIDHLRSIYINLKNESIIQQLHSGEIKPQSLAFMTHQEMKPERWKELIENKQKRDHSKFNTNIQASTDLFTCRKCKSKNCTYYELQTRSADEPMSLFVQCIDCGKNWREQ
jgi:transcription elongation factor S-II